MLLVQGIEVVDHLLFMWLVEDLLIVDIVQENDLVLPIIARKRLRRTLSI